MAKIPEKAVDISSVSSPQILNAIRNDEATDPRYRAIVPEAQDNFDSIQKIGGLVVGNPILKNAFIDALNRIGEVIVTSKLYRNPWEMFKRGRMENGESIEELFVELTTPFKYDFNGDRNPFKVNLPDVRRAMHVMNYQFTYEQTVSNQELKLAFLSYTGVQDLASRIIDSIFTSANYDEFLAMKYMLAENIRLGLFYSIQIPAVDKENASDIVTQIKTTSNDLTFMRTKYNPYGVHNFTDKEDQILIMNSSFDAINDVNVLASAFNIDRVIFMGNRVLIDSFGELDVPRLDELFGDEPSYHHYTAEELKLLDAVPAILVDRKYFMVYDNLYEMGDIYDPTYMRYNYYFNTWKTLSWSPVSNAVLFSPEPPAVTSVTVSPGTATASKGQQVQFQANAVTTGFAPSTVTWSLTGAEGTPVASTIDTYGIVYIDAAEQNTSLTVTATSAYDSTKTGTATLTIA